MERIISIHPGKSAEYKRIVEEKFHEVHQDWKLACPSFEYFRQQIANASFLAYLERFLEAAGDNGHIKTAELEKRLREELGEYFSPDKFENAVNFIQDEGWKDL